MKICLEKGLDDKAKSDLKASYGASRLYREALAKALRDKIEAARSVSVSKDAYTNPAWPYLQADNVGYERALREIASLLE